ncbi:protein brambleberry-like [Rhopilema esculentum]|uniref:protein brambleberry-like n=1 Tax=Rhopilema esculentum TaxID=499914 RepID=UPI0031D7CC23
MNYLARVLVIIVLVQFQARKSTGIWWWVFSNSDEQQQQQPEPTGVATASSFGKVFVPFELTEVESKFLSEASHYLGNLPKLDQCNLLIVNRLKSSCNKLTEMDLSKLSVNLLNCQSAIEGRKIYKCTEDMELSECTKDMDPDTWNAYHVISNRARAVCYSVRQTEFRIKTEVTINSLASSARENLVSLQHLLASQKDLGNKTSETITHVVEGGNKAVKVQTELNSQQISLKEAINENIDELSREKELMEKRQEDIKKHSLEVKRDLEEIAGTIKEHHVARASSDKELLSQVQAIQIRAQDVLSKLDKAVSNMDNHYANIEERHSKIIENVQDIQQAINFVSEMIVNFEDSFHDQMKWINEAVGGTRDRISVISILLGHIIQLTIMLLMMIFCGSPLLSKTTMVVLLPMNCVLALQEKHHFTYKEMLVLVALTYPATWIFCYACRLKSNFIWIEKALQHLIQHLYNLVPCDLLFYKRKYGKEKAKDGNSSQKGCEDLDLTDAEEEDGQESVAGQSIITSTPHKLGNSFLNRSINQSLSRSADRQADVSIGANQAQRRCGSLTRNGQRCKSFCRRGGNACSRHESSYNSYFEQSNVNL